MLDTLTPVSEIKFGNINIPIDSPYLDNFNELSLPEVFGENSTIYSFVTDNGDVLLSNNDNDTSTAPGLWVYKSKTKEFLQLKDNVIWFRGFYALGDYVLISSSHSNWLFNIKDYTLKSLGTATALSVLAKIDDNRVLLGSGSSSTSYLYSYDFLTQSLDAKTDIKGYWNKSLIYETPNSIIISSSTTNTGLFVYEKETQTCNQVYSAGYNYIYCHNINDEYLISANDANLLSYNDTTKECHLLYSGGGWKYSQVIKDRIIISQTAYNRDMGIYDYTTKQYQVLTSGFGNSSFTVVGDKCLCYTGGTSKIGVYSYEDNSFTELDNFTNPTCFAVNDELCLMSSANSSYPGVYLYKTNDNSITQIYVEGTKYGYRSHYIIGNYCLIGDSSNTNGGLLSFNILDNSITYLTAGSAFSIFKEINKEVLISSSYTTSGIWLYSPETNSVTKLYNNNYKWINYFEVNGNYYIGNESTSVPSMPGLLYFDTTNKTITQLTSRGMYYSELFETATNKYIVARSNGYLNYIWDVNNSKLYGLGLLDYYNGYTIISNAIYSIKHNKIGLFKDYYTDSSDTKIVKSNNRILMFNENNTKFVLVDCSK